MNIKSVNDMSITKKDCGWPKCLNTLKIKIYVKASRCQNDNKY